MNRAAILICGLFLAACNGKHLAWVDGNDKPQATNIEAVRTNIGGVEFTFDDGPSLSYTPKILAALKKHHLRATFFVEGINLAGESEQAKERRALLKRISDEGHVIGNHSYDHKAFTSLSPQSILWQIDTTSKLIEDTTGKKVELIRLPYGRGNKRIDAILKSRGLTSINWNLDPREWERNNKTHQQKTATDVLQFIMQQYHQLHDEQGQARMIIILHDTKQITAELLPDLLNQLEKQETKQ